MTLIQKKVRQLIKKYKTIDPFELADNLNIIVLFWYLHHEINGFYKLEQRNRFIVINKNLADEEQRFVCAHELGHAILHRNINTPFFRKYTFFSVDRIEMEANTFAVELLIPDDELSEKRKRNTCLTIREIAQIFKVPQEVVRLKFF